MRDRGPSELVYGSVVAVWRSLRSMRTALILLLLVAVASILGSLVPQLSTARGAVVDLFRSSPTLARFYDAVGLFDVYGSWWFTLCYALLLISLASCLLPRTRALWRGRARQPMPMRELEGLRHLAEGRVSGTPEDALDRARRTLRRRRFRVRAAPPGLAAEKGGAREVGSLVFHWSLFLLLVGAVYGKGFGFTGQATIVEGETWTEGHASYDLPPDEGRFFGESMHRGFRLHLDDFDASYRANGVPRDFVSRVTLGGGSSAEVRVNHPLEIEGVKLYQQGYGWAPVLEVRAEERVLAQQPVVFITSTPNDQRTPWRGVIKLPSLDPQIGIELRLFPDVEAGLLGQPMLEPRNPFLTYTVWQGDLRLTQAQSVFSLDKTGLVEVGGGGIGLGETKELPGGLELRFPELREYTQLLVKRDPGTGVMLLAALLVVLGVLPALYSSRRRVWVRAQGDGGDATRLQVAGFALQRKAAFDDEFREIADELVR